MAGIYISYPFCNQKCTFCNFASDVGTSDARDQYEAGLLEEVANHGWEWTPETLYLGGGTPSLMSDELLRRLVECIPGRGGLAEATMECAPGTVTRERVQLWRECGINRISLGVQSFEPAELRQTGRRHTAETVVADVELLRAAGLNNINLDLIAGLPHQTAESWGRSLNWIRHLDAPHVSVYLFEIDEDSRLGRELVNGGSRYGAADVPSEDDAAAFYEAAVEQLAEWGWGRYEISNFARPGMRSLHNLKYWTLQPYVGFGLDAHSFDGRCRWSNPDSLLAYLSGSRGGERSAADLTEERFFVGLRLSEGIRPTDFEREHFREPIERFTSNGMLIQDGDMLRLSARGVLVSNEIFQEFVHA